MTLKELRDKFIETEEKYNLFENEYNGMKYWAYIRDRFYFALQDEILNFKKGDSKWEKISSFQKVKTFMRMLYLSLFKNPLFIAKKSDVLIFSGSRRILKDEKDFDIYFDYLIDKSEFSYFMIEDYLQGNNYNKPHTEHIAFMDFLYVLQKFLNIFSKKYQINEIEKIINIFNESFNVKIKTKVIYKIFNNLYIEHKYFRNIYRAILNRIKPQILIETVSYGTWKHIFNEEAKKLNVKLVELQHGTMGKTHINYNFAGIKNLSSYPEYIFTFGNYWRETTDFPIKDENIINCGFPHFEAQISEYQKENDKTTILFISQIPVAEELIKLATELNNKLNHHEYHIIYKLHPAEYKIKKSPYDKLYNSTIEVVNNNNKDLYWYFAQADVQVGVYSTAIYEGLGFDLNTFIVKAYGSERMNDLIINKYANLIESSDEIINLIKTKPKNFDKEKFWKSNSIDNLKSAIKKLI